MARKRSRASGAKVYNSILKEFTKINDLLPEDRKLSLPQRRKLISDMIYPSYKGVSPSRLGVRSVRGKIFSELEKIPPNELCDVNYIDPAILPNIDLFGIDEYLQTVIPNCIYIKLSAGIYGETKIFNTRDYHYIKSGVRDIVETIREALDNGQITSEADWQGYKKLKKGKTNDGTPENYYIDFILVLSGEPVVDATVVQYKIPKNRETKKKQTSYRNAILGRLKSLTAKKRRRKRATKTHKKNITELKKLKKRLKISKRGDTVEALNYMLLERFDKAYASLEKDFENGLMTQEQLNIRKQNLYDNFFKKGGQVD